MLPTIETTIDPKQLRRVEKNPNMHGALHERCRE
jgi:hypothetical protein